LEDENSERGLGWWFEGIEIVECLRKAVKESVVKELQMSQLDRRDYKQTLRNGRLKKKKALAEQRYRKLLPARRIGVFKEQERSQSTSCRWEGAIVSSRRRRLRGPIASKAIVGDARCAKAIMAVGTPKACWGSTLRGSPGRDKNCAVAFWSSIGGHGASRLLI
jgi:hypothetical protein